MHVTADVWQRSIQTRCARLAIRLDTPAMSLFPRLTILRFRPQPIYNATRTFSHTPNVSAKSLPPRPELLDSDLIEKFLHGSGPGGQKINKTSSAVQLKHIPTGIVVKYQDTRSRTVNRKMARKILQEKIEEETLGEEARTRVKQRAKSGKKRSAEKKRRRKYRKLAEGEEGEEGIDLGENERALDKQIEVGETMVDDGAVKDDGVTERMRKPSGG